MRVDDPMLLWRVRAANQIWGLALPLRGIPSLREVRQVSGAEVLIRTRTVDVGFDFNALAGLVAPAQETDPDFRIFPAVDPFKRSGFASSFMGAIAMPSPHQVTIWPSLCRVDCPVQLDDQLIFDVVAEFVSSRLSLPIPCTPGYRRVLGVSKSDRDATMPFKRDFNGCICDYGVNDPVEFGQVVPGSIAIPGTMLRESGSLSWSNVIPSGVSVNSAGQVPHLAKLLNQVMTALGNIWLLVRPENPPTSRELDRIALISRNLGSLVESSIELFRTKADMDRDTKRVKNPVTGQFTGSDAGFIKLVALSFDQIPALRGFLARWRAELEVLAKE